VDHSVDVLQVGEDEEDGRKEQGSGIASTTELVDRDCFGTEYFDGTGPDFKSFAFQLL
jgi:hypothetical protein